MTARHRSLTRPPDHDTTTNTTTTTTTQAGMIHLQHRHGVQCSSLVITNTKSVIPKILLIIIIMIILNLYTITKTVNNLDGLLLYL